ncbi:MAG: prephenate dehydrogenase/arogenate dehydrogenase family protein [Thermoplasmata archaeon]|nr:prephenate dehydrogenase/arogenate dehydrogenase family protein [Thermoplasmata archaeon]
MAPHRSTLARLRAQVDRADRDLARAIGRRLTLAAAIGRSRRRTSSPLRDYARESRVLGRWRRRLAATGVELIRSEPLARWLIEESLRVQEAGPRPRRRPQSPGRRIAIVGAAGGMGRWLDDFLSDAGHDVRLLDPKVPRSSPRRLASIEAAMTEREIVAFATPIRGTAKVLERALRVRSPAVVFDVLSVKAPIAHLLRAAPRRGRPVTSLHPMFGPSARTLSGRNLLLVTCGVPEADRPVRALFSHSAANLPEVRLERHDQLISESLGPAHLVNLLFLAALASDPLTPHDLARAASTTFHRQSTLAASVAREGPELYLDIQSQNPPAGETYAAVRVALTRLSTLVQRQDLPGFRKLLVAGRAKIEPGPEPMRS